MKTTKRFDAVGIGCCAVDMLAVVDPFPKPDEKALVKQLSQQGGGLVSTGLVAIARLGGKARYVGSLGDTALAAFARSEFEREGVDVSAVLTVPGKSVLFSYGVATPSTGTRTMFVDLTNKPDFHASELKQADVLSGRFLYVDGFEMDAAMQAAEWATAAGMKILIDAEFMFGGIDELVAVGDYVIASMEFAQAHVGGKEPREVARKFYAAQKDLKADKVVVVTAGTRGSFGVTAAGEFHQPAFVVEVVDTTGAGDVYHGAFLYALAQEWPLPQCARFASAVAALKCRKLGGRAGIPTRPEADAFLASNPKTHPAG